MLIVFWLIVGSRRFEVGAQGTSTPPPPFGDSLESDGLEFKPWSTATLYNPSPYPQCPVEPLSPEDQARLDPKWLTQCSHCLPNAAVPTSQYQIQYPTSPPINYGSYSLTDVFYPAHGFDSSDIDTWKMTVQYVTNYERVVGIVFESDTGGSAACEITTAQNSATGQGHLPLLWSSGYVGWRVADGVHCFASHPAACSTFDYAHEGFTNEYESQHIGVSWRFDDLPAVVNPPACSTSGDTGAINWYRFIVRDNVDVDHSPTPTPSTDIDPSKYILTSVVVDHAIGTSGEVGFGFAPFPSGVNISDLDIVGAVVASQVDEQGVQLWTGGSGMPPEICGEHCALNDGFLGTFLTSSSDNGRYSCIGTNQGDHSRNTMCQWIMGQYYTGFDYNGDDGFVLMEPDEPFKLSYNINRDGNCSSSLCTGVVQIQLILYGDDVIIPATSTPSPTTTNTPPGTDTPEPDDFYVDYLTPLSTSVGSLCLKGEPNDWYPCGDLNLITNNGDPIVGYLYTGTVSAGTTGNITIASLQGVVGGIEYDNELSMQFPLAISSGETRSICVASNFYTNNGAPNLEFDQLCNYVGLGSYEQASAGNGYSVENGQQVRLGYRIGWAGGSGNAQLSNVGLIRFGGGLQPTNTPAPTATTTVTPTTTITSIPTGTQTATSTSTPLWEGGYCSTWQFRDDTPIVDIPDIDVSEGSCQTIVPGTDINVPGVGDIFSWKTYMLCSDVVNFGGFDIGGFSVGIDILLLLPIMAFARKVIWF